MRAGQDGTGDGWGASMKDCYWVGCWQDRTSDDSRVGRTGLVMVGVLTGQNLRSLGGLAGQKW